MGFFSTILKLLDIDSSFAARKELATELAERLAPQDRAGAHRRQRGQRPPGTPRLSGRLSRTSKGA
jgi:hypothetical protein